MTNAPTPYELAKLRLQAFALLDGWGVVNEKGVFTPHTMTKRQEIALEFVGWALTDHDDPESKTDA